MKKFIAVATLLLLFAVATLVPDEIREAKRVYEQRMAATVDVIEETLRSVPTGGLLTARVYAPEVDLRDDLGLLVVTGVVGLLGADGTEHFEPFAAAVRNTCEGAMDSGCLQVDTLTLKESKLVEAGEVAGRLPDVLSGSAGVETQPAPIGDIDDSEQADESAEAEPQPSSANPAPDAGPNDPDAQDPTGPQAAGTSDDRLDDIDQVAKIQRALKELGYDPGPVDNVVGPKTLSAILAYQRRHGLELDGKASPELLRHIRGVSRDGAN